MTTSKPEDKRDKTYGDYWSGKKPYLIHDYRKMMQRKTQEEYYFHELHSDPMSELLRPYLADPNIEGFGWEYMSPPDINFPPVTIVPPGGWPPPGDCELSCGPSMLDCEGGCTIIACICADGELLASITQDPTGTATVAVLSNTMVQVCVEPFQTDTEYPAILVQISDSEGTVISRVALVDCQECCDETELTGSATVNPGSVWTGTVSPACPGAECSVTSNSSCTGFSCVINGSGSQVTVAVPDDACGSFTVTVTDHEDECGNSTSMGVKINNTGQGGRWELDQSSTDLGLSGCDPCGCGSTVTSYTDSCDSGEYRYGGFGNYIPPGPEPCEDGVAIWSHQCKGTGSAPCNDPPVCEPNGSQPPCQSKSPACLEYQCHRWSWWRCKWECNDC